MQLHDKMFGSGVTTLIISYEEINDIMKIVKSLEETGLLTKRVSETIENEAKEQKGRFLEMLLATLRAGLLGNLLTGKGAIETSQGGGTVRTSKGIFRASKGTVGAGQDFNAASSFNQF